jgi:HD-GYP domain-containing protein (c-di-GMP phosphodiesterase class II)
MAPQSLENFLIAFKEGREYIPIQVSSLRADMATDFDLYMQPTPGEPAVLYADRTIPFSAESRRRLEENKIQYLYISNAQMSEYRNYVESNMQAILNDVAIHMEEKSHLLHITAQGVVRDVLEKSDLKQGLKRGHELIEHTVDFLFGQRASLRHLVECASTDYEIYSHSINVCVMGIALAQRMGYPAESLVEFGHGAMFRDIGLMNIDDSIVNNTGRLTLTEYEKIQQHTTYGEEIMKDLGITSEITLDVVRHHHEKLDGTGYPDKLQGDEISPLVRICNVIDIFDALTTNRVHKKAISTYEALTLINKEMRNEIDFEVLRSFITMLGFSK